MAASHNTCRYPECAALVGPKGAKGMCPHHYKATRPPCTVEGCNKVIKARGLCSMHHARWSQTGDVHQTPSGRIVYPKGEKCAFDGCENPRRKRDWCGQHYNQYLRTGEVRAIENPWRDEPGLPCDVCGHPTDTRSRYCGDACKAAKSREAKSGMPRPETFTCEVCDREIPLGGRERGRFKRADTIYCDDCGRETPDARRFKRYGVRPSEYEAALLIGCEICGDKPDTLHVDHDHACCPPDQSRLCGECNRGFLCGNCNRGIGLLQEQSDIILRAAWYLEQYR